MATEEGKTGEKGLIDTIEALAGKVLKLELARIAYKKAYDGDGTPEEVCNLRHKRRLAEADLIRVATDYRWADLGSGLRSKLSKLITGK